MIARKYSNAGRHGPDWSYLTIGDYPETPGVPPSEKTCLVLASISDSPFHNIALTVEQVRDLVEMLQAKLAYHYTNTLIHQIAQL